MDDRTRRTFLMMSVGLIVSGCATTDDQVDLPGTPWDQSSSGSRSGRRPGTTTTTRTGHASRGTTHVRELPPDYSAPRPQSLPSNGPTVTPSQPTTGMNGVIARPTWAKGNPIPGRMDRMTRITRITVHHDGMGTPFNSDTSGGAMSRMESIRRSHLNRGWGDIGYHYVVDRGGRVYEARPMYWQGAHVKYNNPGNIGVMCLGNFEIQKPTAAQTEGLRRHLARLMSMHNVSVRSLYTHKELRPTLCPGRSLQPFMDSIRTRRLLG